MRLALAVALITLTAAVPATAAPRTDNGAWTRDTVLVADDPEAHQMGRGVAVDGDTVLPGNGWNTGPVPVFVRAGDNWTQTAQLVVEAPNREDHVMPSFGSSVGLDGRTAVVGTPGAPVGDPFGDGVESAGAVFPFQRSLGSWTQDGRLDLEEPSSEDGFGRAVAIDGDTVVVGAPWEDDRAGAAYVYERAPDTWRHEGANDEFELGTPTVGPEAATSGSNVWGTDLDGDYETHADQVLLSPTIDLGAVPNGADVALNASIWFHSWGLGFHGGVVEVDDGSTITRLTPTAGPEYRDDTIEPGGPAYSGDLGGWHEAGFDLSAFTGEQIRLRFRLASGTGLTDPGFYVDDVRVCAGTPPAPQTAVELPRRCLFRDGFEDPNGWSRTARIAPADGDDGDKFGAHLSLDGDTLLASAHEDEDPHGPGAGSAYVFERAGGSWSQQAKLVPADPGSELGAELEFGAGVAVDGDTALVGAPGADGTTGELGVTTLDVGAAYVLERGRGEWSQQATLGPDDPYPHDEFGAAVALQGPTAVVGAPDDDNAQTPNYVGDNDGAAYVFAGSGSTWEQLARLNRTQTYEDAFLGTSVALEGTTVVAGVPGDDNEYGRNAGSLHAFSTPIESTLPTVEEQAAPAGLGAGP